MMLQLPDYCFLSLASFISYNHNITQR